MKGVIVDLGINNIQSLQHKVARLGIEVEVEFQPIYEKQALFSDVDSFIRGNLGLQIQAHL